MRKLLRIFRAWRQRRYKPLITVEISAVALRDNLRALKGLAPNWQIAPVLKSNAYGHGLLLVARALEAEDIPFFCVDSYFEARILRTAGVATSLLVIGYSSTETIEQNTLKEVAFMVGSLEQLNELVDGDARQTVQIKFDTGMHRQGIPHTQVGDVLAVLKKESSLSVVGAFSHLASADTVGSTLTEQQIERWNELVRQLRLGLPSIKYFHLANSSGFGYAEKIDANVGRSGLALYGISPGNLTVALRPVLTMKSVIADIHIVEAGQTVGYGETFVAQKTMRLATVPVGYFEGVDRRLSNRGSFLINGRPAPICGRVSMNISSADVTDIPNAQRGVLVTIISSNPADENSVANIARLCETIPYEILVHIPAHPRRVAVD